MRINYIVHGAITALLLFPLDSIAGEKDVWLDNQTGLMWSNNLKNNESTENLLSFENAIQYCSDLKVGGYQDWLLPDLESLRNVTMNDNDLIFNKKYNYWTSSLANDGNIYVIRHENGNYNTANRSKDGALTRCVRGNVTFEILASFLMHNPIKQEIMSQIKSLIKPTSRKDGLTVLIWSIQTGRYELARMLIQNGVNVNEKTDEGSTALTFAAEDAPRDILKMLINNGAEINHKINDVQLSALHIAIITGNFDIAKLLIENGADINIRTNVGETPLMAAATGTLEKMHTAAATEGTIFSAEDEKKLQRAFGRDTHDDISSVKYLIDNGADVKAKTIDGRNAFSIALLHDKINIAKFLQKKGAKVIGNSEGVLSLLKQGEIDLADEVIKNGADLNQNVKVFNKPIIRLALEDGNLNIIKFIVEHGAKINIKDEDGFPLLRSSKNIQTAQYLISKGLRIDDNTALGALYNQNIKIFEFFLKEGHIDINERMNIGGHHGMTYLMVAAERHDYHLIDDLLSLGANLYAKDDNGNSVMDYAKMNKEDSDNTIRILSEKGL